MNDHAVKQATGDPIKEAFKKLLTDALHKRFNEELPRHECSVAGARAALLKIASELEDSTLEIKFTQQYKK